MGGPGLCAGLASPHLPAMSHSTCHGSQSPEASQLTGEPDAAAPCQESEPGEPATNALGPPRQAQSAVGLKGPESPNWPQRPGFQQDDQLSSSGIAYRLF